MPRAKVSLDVGGLRVHRNATTASVKIDEIEPGMLVDIVTRAGTWTKIGYTRDGEPRCEGWVATSKLVFIPDAPPVPPPEPCAPDWNPWLWLAGLAALLIGAWVLAAWVFV